MDIPLLIIGTIGAAVLLAAFALEQTGVITDKSYAYDCANVIGSGLLGWYAFVGHVYPFVVLEVVWATVALYYILGRLAGKGKGG
ncbi:MAG: hypothetical protein WDN10_04570 [bacterium]